jgi:16S rRNA (adenine1518-N6/adenine1519-N6)-dimethyltransferase
MLSQMEVLRKYGIKPVKRRGQNFLIDGNMSRTIAEEIISIGKNVLELGAGAGAITIPLLNLGASVTAVEIDRHLCEILRSESKEFSNFNLIEEDLAKLKWHDMIEIAGEMPVVAGNLPYVLTSEVLFALAELRDKISGAHFMMQYEVAERMIASEGGKDFGVLAIILGSLFDVELVRPVPPSVFWPQPKVRSALVIMRRNNKLWDDGQLRQLRDVVRIIFTKRRKKISTILKSSFGMDSDSACQLLESAGINKDLRPEQISRELFWGLAELLPSKEA